jgi:hypothetical protein
MMDRQAAIDKACRRAIQAYPNDYVLMASGILLYTNRFVAVVRMEFRRITAGA